ncbi:hypothetical protein REPUB_Repub20aG0022300 [Reevesia pubescens]
MSEENSSDCVIPIQPDPAFEEFYTLLGECLPPECLDLYQNNREEFLVKFGALSVRERDFLVAVLRESGLLVLWERWDRFVFEPTITVNSIFEYLLPLARQIIEAERVAALCAAPNRIPPYDCPPVASFSSPAAVSHAYAVRFQSLDSPDMANIHPSNNTGGTLSHLQRSLALHDGYQSMTPSYVSRHRDATDSGIRLGVGGPSRNMGATETISCEISTAAYSPRRLFEMSSNMNNSHNNFEVGTSHQSARTMPEGHNCHFIYPAYPVYGYSTRRHGDSRLIHVSNHTPNYGASAQRHLQIQAGHVRVFRSTSNIHTAHIQSESASHDGATRDDETAGHSKLFKTLLPVNFTNAYQAAEIVKFIHNNPLPLFIKIYGYLTGGLAIIAGFSSLVGLSLCTFKPSTLPFGCNPQVVMRIMHNVGVHTTGYAFIGTMCHKFLQDDPFLMWIIAGLASAIFMAVMTFIGKRR